MIIQFTSHPSISNPNAIRLPIALRDTTVVLATVQNPAATKSVTKPPLVVDTVAMEEKVAKEEREAITVAVASVEATTVALVAKAVKEAKEATMEVVDLNSTIMAVKSSVMMITTTLVVAVLLATVTAMVVAVVAVVVTVTVSAAVAVAVLVATVTMVEVPRTTVLGTVTKSVTMSSAAAEVVVAARVGKEEKVATMVEALVAAMVAREAKEGRVEATTRLLPSSIKNAKQCVTKSTNRRVILRRIARATTVVILPRRNRNVIPVPTATDTTVVPNTSLHHL